jgi:leucyl-tRNA synthetase
MDTFVDSSWYYARFCCPDQNAAMVDGRVDYWMPVDQYIGGIEHAILHLLYSRFWTKVMRDLGLVRYDEPFKHLLTQGMVLNHIFSRRGQKGGISYFAPDEVELKFDADGRVIGAKSLADGEPVTYEGVGTMSKSKRNGVDPQTLIDQYGADTARFFMMFASPPEQTLEWSDAGVEGSFRFLKRTWAFAQQNEARIRSSGQRSADWSRASQGLKDARREIHLLLKQATYDLSRFQFNTVASAAMKILNTLERCVADAGESSPSHLNGLVREGVSVLLRLLSPITPHISQHLWSELGFGEDILEVAWPEPLAEALVQDEIDLVLQINGKHRGSLRVPMEADSAAIEKITLASDIASKYIAGQSVKKVVVVRGRLVNIVL